MSLLAQRLIDDVRARTSLVSLIGRVVKLTRAGREMKGRCPFHDEKTPSFYVIEGKGFFHCFGCGAHGTAVDFVMRWQGLEFRSAVLWLAADCGIVPDEQGNKAPLRPPVERPSDDEISADDLRQIDRARGLWRRAAAGDGTPVEAYLRSRGVRLPVPPTLRYVRDLPYWHRRDGADRAEPLLRAPAMIAPLQQADGIVAGIHLTWLRPGGEGKAQPVDPDTGELLPTKKMRGASWGAAIRLAPAGARMGIAEGIETALSVIQATGLSVWAAASLDNLAGRGDPDRPATPHPARPGRFVPTAWPDRSAPGIQLPDVCTEVTLLGDGDSDPYVTAALLERAARRFRAEGRRVRIAIAPHGSDFNDVLRGAA